MKEYKENDDIVYLSKPSGSFESIYAKLRKAEGRDYDDSTVEKLPGIGKDSRHIKEWKIREHSSNMLAAYIRKNPDAKRLLEVGCGNGWLVNRLSGIDNTKVWGLDVNIEELKQAARVFGSNENIVFAFGDIFEINSTALKQKFDYIILPAVLAYFEEPAKLVKQLFKFLKPRGEIHIIDCPFYKDILMAKERSRVYFESLGCSDMTMYYHHHSLDVLGEFNYTILYDPDKITSRIKRYIFNDKPPFYWINITAQKRRIRLNCHAI